MRKAKRVIVPCACGVKDCRYACSVCGLKTCAKCGHAHWNKYGSGIPACTPIRDRGIVSDAFEGLQEYYPDELTQPLVTEITARLTVPNTGNDQADYENVRDQIEKHVQNYMMDGRLI